MEYKSVIIIAEAGVNHNGDINLAKKMIDIASDAGADYIKFQTFISELGVTRKAIKADYQITNTNDSTESMYEMVKKLELKFDDFTELYNYCNEKNIGFLSTAFDFPSIDFINNLNLPFFKIPSGEITNKPYLKKIAQLGKPIIMSTGMANLDEVKVAFNIFLSEGLKEEQIIILHCNTEYPTPFEDVNLNAMLLMRDKLGVKIGYSDHTIGIEVPIAAVALGATVIEKHFTLDRNLPGPDHKASLEPNELKTMVAAIRNVEKALAGSGLKEPSISEIKNINIARKSIVAATKINKDELFTEENLLVKRPGNGISPLEWDNVIGKKAKQNFQEDDLIEL